MMSLDSIEALREKLFLIEATVKNISSSLDSDQEISDQDDSSVTIREIQSSVASWVKHNFPSSTAQDEILGMQEDLGKLARAYLKSKQKIRGYSFSGDKSKREMSDAIGNMMIYMLGFCESVGIDLESEVFSAWEKIKKLDWSADPDSGGRNNDWSYSSDIDDNVIDNTDLASI